MEFQVQDDQEERVYHETHVQRGFTQAEIELVPRHRSAWLRRVVETLGIQGNEKYLLVVELNVPEPHR